MSSAVEFVYVFVEEPSMEAALQVLLPKLLGEDGPGFQISPFQSKQDLLGKLPARLAGLRAWIPKTYRVLVLVDRDDDSCEELKDALEAMAVQASFATKTAADADERWVVANRIVCEELEAWFWGDLEAVRAAYPRVNASAGRASKYRDPDAIAGGTWEALQRLLQRYGYHKPRLRKIEAARKITPHMDPARNRSRSFRAFREVCSRWAVTPGAIGSG